MTIMAKQRCCDCCGVDALLGHRLSVGLLCSLLVWCGTRHAGNGLFRSPANRQVRLRHSSGKHARRLVKETQAPTMPAQTTTLCHAQRHGGAFADHEMLPRAHCSVRRSGRSCHLPTCSMHILYMCLSHLRSRRRPTNVLLAFRIFCLE
jgi:hypothetical protein